MLSLAETGLGALRWLHKASQTLSIPAADLMDFMALTEHPKTNSEISNVLINYVNKEYSWAWSRLFHDGAFFALRTRQNSLYSMVLLSITAGNDPSSSLWDIPSINVPHGVGQKDLALSVGKNITRLTSSSRSNSTIHNGHTSYLWE